MIFSTLFSRISGPVLIALGAIVGLFAAFRKAYTKGVEQNEAEHREREYDQLKTRAEVAEDISAMSDDAVTDELRQYIKNRDKKLPPGTSG